MREKLILAALVLVAFGASVAGSFQFDDAGLLADPAITSPSGWWESWRPEQTRPLTWFTFWLNYQIAGERPAPWHAVNLLLHMAVVLLLLDVLKGFLPARAALLAAAFFAVHPLLAEPVNYIYARGTLLAALFSLLAVRAWIAERSWQAVAWFTLAMLAKEECAALPVVLALLDRKRPKPLMAMFAVALAAGLRTIWAAAVVPGSQAGSQAGVSPLDYFATQGVVIWRYLRMTVLPRGFTVDPAIAKPSWVKSIVFWVASGELIAMVATRSRAAALFFGAGMVLLLPSSSVFPAADLAADRRMYLPMLALCGVAGLAAERIPRAWSCVAILALTAISVLQTQVWRTPESLWSQAHEHAPHKARPALQLARTVEPSRGLRLVTEAALYNPADASISAEQGRLLLTLGRPQEALSAFGRALALEPEDARNLNNRGAALLALGQGAAARADFERALKQDSCLFDARLNLRRMGVETPARGCRYTARQRDALRTGG